jgi:hypothetical protein
VNDLYKPDDTRDMLRKVGGLLFGLACVMIFIRKSGGDGHWAKFPMFLVLAIPAAYLYGAVFTKRETGGLRPWQTVHSVFGLILIPLALSQFVNLIGGSSGASLNVFWIFGLTALAGFYAGAIIGVRVQLLIGSIALIVSWSALWNKILSDGIGAHYGIYRGLLGILAIGLLAGALYMWRENPGGDETAASATSPVAELGLWKASELLTAAGIAAVLACAIGGVATLVVDSFSTNVGTLIVTPVHTSNFWDILLLLVSLGLVGLGSQIGARGPVYIGGIGLLLFVLIAGLDLNNNPPHQHSFGTWPWVLLVLGLLALGLSFVREASLGDQPRRLTQNLRGR